MTIGTLAARIMADASGIKAGMGMARDELKITRQAFVDSTSDLERHNTALAKVESAYEKGALSGEQYRRVVDQLNKEFRDDAAAAYQKKLTDIGENMRTAGTAVAASAGAITAGLVMVGRDFVNTYAEAQDAQEKLSAAMRAAGTASTRTMNSYQKFAAGIQDMTKTDGDAAIGMLQVAESLGVSGTAAERAVKNAIALGSALGLDADKSMKLTVALEAGNASMLTRYIPALKGIKDPAEQAALAQDMLGKMFSAAEAEAKTYAGSTAQLGNAIDDVKESFGEIIAETMTPFMQQAKGMVESFGEMSGESKQLIVNLGMVGTGFTAVMAATGTVVAAAGQLTIWYGALQASAYGATVAQLGLGAAIGATSVAAGAVAFGAGFAFGQWLYDLTPWGENANRVLKDVHDSMQLLANIDMSGNTQDGLNQFIASTERQIEKIQEHNQELQNQQAWYNGWQANADIIAANNEQLDTLNANLNKAIQEQNQLNAAQQEATGDKNAQALRDFEAAEARARRESAAATEEMRLQQEELRDLEQAAGDAGNAFLTGMAPGIQESMAEMDQYANAIKQVNQATDQTIAKLNEQIDTHGMSEESQQAYRDAQEIARLSEMGASEEQLAQVRELQQELARLKQVKDEVNRPTASTMGVVSMGEAFDIARQGAMRSEPIDRFAGIGEAVTTAADPATMEVWTQIAAGINALVQKEGLTVEEVSL
jgi:hypothetical protein